MATSALVGQIIQGGKTGDIDLSPGNPLQQEPEKQIAAQGISEDDKAMLVKIITQYRTDWAPDRLFRIPIWMKNNLFYRGLQVLGWDPQNQTYFDALAWYRQSGLQTPGSDDYLEKYINNITQALGTAYVGIMSAGIPGTKVKPENAEILADVTTARAGQEAIGIIERMNESPKMVRKENLLIYLYGVYFKVTKLVVDGDFAGWDEEPVFGQIAINKPDRYHCSQCGYDLPLNGKALGTGDQQQSCPECNAPLGPGDFYPAESSAEEGILKTRKVPRVGVKWGVHSPLECDGDPQANTIADTPVFSLDLEIDIGMARKMMPGAIKKIQEGADVQTTPNASYERLRRTESYSKGYGYTSDQSKSKITYSQNWMQPSSYYRIQQGDDKDQNGMTFAQRMEEAFPDGLKISMLGPEVVHIRPAILTKEVTACMLHENCGLFCPSIAENVVPFNERFNDTTDLIDDWIQRCASGMVLYDTTKIDKKQMKGVQMAPGTLNGVATKGSGVDKPLAESLLQFKFEIDGNAFNYPGMILQWCYFISGLQPQQFGGGTQEKVDTLGGQERQLEMANTRLRTGFENLKGEHAQAGQNALEMLQWAVDNGLITELWDVIEENGSEFRNNYVDLHKMNGRARVSPDEDQGLPTSPEQLRELFMELIKEVPNNPVAAALLDVDVNQEVIMDSLTGNAGLVKPGEAQRSRTMQHINILLKQDWKAAIGANGQAVPDLPVKPEKNVENFVKAEETIKLFRQENGDLAQTNPEGWARLDAYFELLKSLEAQAASEDAQRKAKVTAASQPAPDQDLVLAKQNLLKDAAVAAEALTKIAAAPPLPKGAGSANVAAGKEIIDSVVKAVVS